MTRWLAPLICFAGALAIAAAADVGGSAGSDPFTQARAAYDRGDFGTAREHFRVLAEIGQPKAQTMMGHIYFAPRAVRQNLVVAGYWYERAAAKSEPNGQYMHAVLGLSDTWFRLQGLEREPMDPAIALDLLRKAAGQGLTDAILLLADVLADDALAPELAERFARRLGLVALRLEDIAKNDAESTLWLRKAAEQGHAYAQELLGMRYLQGASVPKDKGEACFWLSLASRRPQPPDDQALDFFGIGRTAYQALIKRRDRTCASLGKGGRAGVEQRLAAWQPSPQPDFGTDLYTPAERRQMANPKGLGIGG
jgi:TPR repeat protein